MATTTWTITSGLPFSKELSVTLPSGRSWWTNLTQFEVLFQIREGKARETPLVKDLAEFLNVSMINANQFKIDFIMTGSNTRDLTRGGYFDIIMSDVGTTDARAFVILNGIVKRLSTVTAELEGEV